MNHEAEPPSGRGRHLFEQFASLRAAQEGLARQGYFFHPLEREHVEGVVTEPVVHRLRTQVHKRGFGHVAGHVVLTFSGYADDPREIWQIPEVRAYWQQLSHAYDEFPALLAYLPAFGFNGPGQVRSSKERVEFSPQASRIGGTILGSPALPCGESQQGP